MEITYQNGYAVAHFLEFADTDHKKHRLNAVPFAYDQAVEHCNAFNGKKWHRQSYGGGIAFRCEQDAHKAKESAIKKGLVKE
jgi:hypothetical protein